MELEAILNEVLGFSTKEKGAELGSGTLLHKCYFLENPIFNSGFLSYPNDEALRRLAKLADTANIPDAKAEVAQALIDCVTLHREAFQLGESLGDFWDTALETFHPELA